MYEYDFGIDITQNTSIKNNKITNNNLSRNEKKEDSDFNLSFWDLLIKKDILDENYKSKCVTHDITW